MTYLSGLPEEDKEAKSRRCPFCRAEKSVEQFPRNRSVKSGRGNYCKPCHNAISKRNRERAHGSVRNYWLKRRYGITEDDLRVLVERQEGLCAICRSRRARHVDHDHATGRVRGILCFRCNGALGQFSENCDWLQRAAEYVEPLSSSVSEESATYGAPMKICRDCGENKRLEDFPRNRNSGDGRHCYCKPCHNARGRETKARLYGNSRHYHLSQKYGIGAPEVSELIKQQGGTCAVCRERPAEQVDHDHQSGRVRGVLCGGCNAGLGQFGDDPDIIRRAIEYLIHWSTRRGTVQEPTVPYILSVA